ncbi:DUF1254 domain-containing protein [Neobacillus drentensis]|uniref:DUF1254 domain-containing protein n=1 Tax=Neobacillus drentensis TaxID=220684 RepID=UPI0030035C52
MKKKVLVPVIGLLTSMSVLAGSALADSPMQNNNNTPQNTTIQTVNATFGPQDQYRSNLAYSIGVEAYLYGFPLVSFAKSLQVITAAAPMNTFFHFRNLLDDTFRGVVSPNNDTLYSASYLDLSNGPMVLSIPKAEKGRYFSFQFIDAYTNSFHYIGTRTGDIKGGSYVIVGPNWKGTLKKGTKIIKAPTNLILLGGRTLVDGEKDLPNVHAIQDKYKLTPYNIKQEQSSFNLPKIVPTDFSDPAKFFDLMTKMMIWNAPPKSESALINQFKLIGVDPKTGFKGISDPAVLDGLTRAVNDAKEIMAKSSTTLGTNNNNWFIFDSKVGNFGDDYLLRAVTAYVALFANIPEEAMYPRATVDSTGNKLTGENKYVIHMEKDEIPPVEGFWSISMYGADQYFVSNSLNRFAIGDRTEGLKYNPDGSLDIYIQNEAPSGHESNWLPAPSGDFNLMLRMYIPSKEALNGSYKMPRITKVINNN